MKASKIYRGLTPKQRRRCELKASGLLGVEIAKIEGVTPGAVYASLQASEARVRRNLSLPVFDYSQIKNATPRRVRMYRDGFTVKQIAEIEGVRPNAIYYSIKVNKMA